MGEPVPVKMTDEEIVACLVNILCIAGADNEFTPEEEQAIENIRIRMCAEKAHLEKAVSIVHKGEGKISNAGRFSDQVRNIEDMILVAMADGALAPEEKKEILSFAKTLGLSQKQINRILSETNEIVNNSNSGCVCPHCSSVMDTPSNFCINCGAKLS